MSRRIWPGVVVTVMLLSACTVTSKSYHREIIDGRECVVSGGADEPLQVVCPTPTPAPPEGAVEGGQP